MNRQERTRNRVIETKIMGKLLHPVFAIVPLPANLRRYEASPRIVDEGSIC
jgi:hypothetical protein